MTSNSLRRDARLNSESEVTLSGDLAAIEAVLREHAAVRLHVEGAWHAPAMTGAVEELRNALARVPRAKPRIAMVETRTGGLVADPERLPDLLAEQLIRPCELLAAIHTLVREGVTTFVTLGPGRSLRALLRDGPARRARVLGTETPDDLRATVEALRS